MSDNDFIDDIERLFARITPEDFLLDTSAARENTLPRLGAAVSLSDQIQFDPWVDGLVTMCQRNLHNDKFTNFAILLKPWVQRVFVPDADETGEDFANRLARESQSLGATWLFSAVLAPARNYEDGDEPDDDLDIEADVHLIDQALLDGRLQLGVCWTAARTDSGHEHRAGVVYLNGQSVEGDLDESNCYYHVLGGQL